MHLKLEIEAQLAHLEYDRVFGAEDTQRRLVLHRRLRRDLVGALRWKAAAGGWSTRHVAETLRRTRIDVLVSFAEVVVGAVDEKGAMDADRVASALLPDPHGLAVGLLRDLPLQMKLLADYCRHEATESSGAGRRGRPKDEKLNGIVADFGVAVVARELARRRLGVKAAVSDEGAVALWMARLKKRKKPRTPEGKKLTRRS